MVIETTVFTLTVKLLQHSTFIFYLLTAKRHLNRTWSTIKKKPNSDVEESSPIQAIIFEEKEANLYII